MIKFFDSLFKKKHDGRVTSFPDDQKTLPIPSQRIEAESEIKVGCYPPQFMVGTGQSVGQLRDHNEDTLFSFSSVISDNGIPQAVGLFIVADGMGGHSHGEIASAAATRAAVDYLFRNLFSAVILTNSYSQEKSLQELLETAVQTAHLAVVRQAPGGGTTLTMALVIKDQAVLAHVGDSRAYLVEIDGKVTPLTVDHSLVRRLVDLGQLTEEQSRVFPQKNVLYRALGQVEPLNPDLTSVSIPDQGVLLLCSDGLWGVVEEKEIVKMILDNADPVICCQKLVEAANAAGGPDNISAVLVRYVH